jgi:tRNA (cmo5U34)-methyltransferase
MDIVKQHFENEANEYDQIIIRLIPYYPQMLDGLINAIPFSPKESINVLDLGCGTGTISKRVKGAYPFAQVTCVDIADNMIAIAKQKLQSFTHISYRVADFNQLDLENNQYDVVVSSLALHHLDEDIHKINFYKKIYQSLKPGGIFYNADVVLASNDYLQSVYMNEWKNFMLRQINEDEIEYTWLPTYYREDRPAQLISQLSWLDEIGFIDIDVIWKYYNFAVYGGRKGLK